METRAKWKSTSKKASKKPADFWVARLEQLAVVRAPFLACHRALVERVIETCLPGDGIVLEVGAGSGQLCRWSSESSRQRWLHTEPDAAALRHLASEFPQATVRAGSVEKLPFADASVAAVVGLCVLDLVDDLHLSFSEFRRVLRPGGCVVHLLDLTPSHRTLFRELCAAGKVPLPNLFADSSTRKWPEDLLLFELQPMRRLLQELRAQTHPLPHIFGSYFDGFRREHFDVARSTSEYDTYSRSAEVQSLLEMALTSAYQTGFRSGESAPRGVPACSGRHLARRLTLSAERARFGVEVNDVWTAWSHEKAGPEDPVYRSLVLGQERRMPRVPRELLSADAQRPAAGDALLEAGMLVFVARRP